MCVFVYIHIYTHTHIHTHTQNEFYAHHREEAFLKTLIVAYLIDKFHSFSKICYLSLHSRNPAVTLYPEKVECSSFLYTLFL
jgi:hypothetical protein